MSRSVNIGSTTTLYGCFGFETGPTGSNANGILTAVKIA